MSIPCTCVRAVTAISLSAAIGYTAEDVKRTSKEPVVVLEKFVTEEKVEDPNYILPTGPSATSFGFNKPLVETPRSVSVISAEVIDKMGLSAVEDLVRVIPGVYTLTRYGIQGNVDVRDVPADLFFRSCRTRAPRGRFSDASRRMS